jgi:ketosteroid isomerase-like protein
VTDTDEDLIRELEVRRYRAMLDADVDTLSELLADDLVYTHSNAQSDDKTSYLAKVADGTFDYRHIEHPIERIIIAGDCAVVTGQMHGTVVLAGTEKALHNSALAVWSRAANAGWRLLAYQPTVLPAVAP